jgi:hypothetical protein
MRRGSWTSAPPYCFLVDRSTRRECLGQAAIIEESATIGEAASRLWDDEPDALVDVLGAESPEEGERAATRSSAEGSTLAGTPT